MPKWVFKIIQTPVCISEYTANDLAVLKQKLSRFNNINPLVTIVIPTWNEEKGIIHTLISLANTTTDFNTELLVVDNNSTDDTINLLKTLGVTTLCETKQGVGHARTLGLLQAKGKYILTGDSDTLYPAGWISAMTKPMINGTEKNVYCVHGTYSFLPSDATPRWQYGIYEMMSAIVKKKDQKTRPHFNVLGFNCGFIRSKGIEVNGYEIPTQRTFRGTAGKADDNATEDGMMAFRLREAGGTIHPVDNIHARVWTSDRRIQMDGGILNALKIRVKKNLFKR